MNKVIVIFLSFIVYFGQAEVENEVNTFFNGGSHTNNWAVLVCTSRFWFNYRHIANVLSVYRSVKRLGIPDSQIIMMLADDMACNSRNPRPGKVFNNQNEAIDVYGTDVEVDYRGYEVTAENFIRVLTGRLPNDIPRSKRLNTDDRSNILVYMTGHGGEDFLKFQDAEEISSLELADAFGQMWQKRRYHELLFIIDTCQAVSMYSKFYSPNIIAIGSSQIGEDSLSHHNDPSIGVYIIDRYTYYLLEFLETVSPGSKKNMGQLFRICPKQQCISTPGVSTHLFKRASKSALISDFFGNVRTVDLSDDVIGLKDNLDSKTVKSESRITTTEKRTFQRFNQFPSIPNKKENLEEKKALVMADLASLLLLLAIIYSVQSLLRSNSG